MAAACGVLAGVECALGQFGPIGRRVAPAPGQPVPEPQGPRQEGGLPEGPTGVETQTISTGVRVRWTPVAGSVQGYRIYRERLVGPGQWGEGTTITVPATAVEYSDVPPFSGQYRYRVHWYRLMLNSRWSLPSTVTVNNRPAPAPTAPSGVGAADVGERRAMVSWSDESPNETGFELERLPAFPSGRRIVAANVTAVVDDSGPGVFSYRVRALGGSGPSGFSPWTQVRVRDTVPAAPSGVQAVDVGNERDTRLRWTDNSNNETGFRIERERRLTDGTWGEATILAAAANTTELIDAAGGGTFRYRVSATNLEGSSAATEWGGVIVVSGWTELIRSPDSRVVYVSSSEGNDSNDGLSPERPVRTLAAGYALLRHGYPDWMLLKRGDIWRESLGHWKKGGRNGAERMVIWGYGVGPRPRLLTQGAVGLITHSGAGSPAAISHMVVRGLHLALDRATGAENKAGIQLLLPGANWLIEDCRVQNFSTNITTEPPTGEIENLAIRRCVIDSAFSTVSHSQGFAAYNVRGLLVDGCVFHHNGWNESVIGADPTIYNHNLYLGSRTFDVVVKDSIISSAASHGLQARGGGIVRGNVFVRNAIGALVGGGDAPVLGGVQATVVDNVFQDGRDISTSLPRGIALILQNIRSGVVERNVALRDSGGVNGGGAVRIVTSAQWPVREVQIKHNLMLDWRYGLVIQGDNIEAIQFEENVLSQASTGSPLMSLDTPPGTGRLEMRLNRYACGAPAASWFRVGPSMMSLESWRQYEPGAATGVVRATTDLGLEQYYATFGGSPDLSAFLAASLEQREGNWDGRLCGSSASTAIRMAAGSQ